MTPLTLHRRLMHMRTRWCLWFLALLVVTPPLTAQASAPRPKSSVSAPRQRMPRSTAAKRAFERMTGHPKGWPGHVVDHIIPLACGGPDTPSNLQWQTIAEAKRKDKWERKGCRRP